MTTILAFNCLPFWGLSYQLPRSEARDYGRPMESEPLKIQRFCTWQVRPYVWLVAATLSLSGAWTSSAQSSHESRDKPTTRQDSYPQALLQQGFQLHEQGRFAESIPILEQVRRRSPGDYFANLLLGIDLLRSGKAAQAIPRLKQASLARPGEEFPEDYLAEAEASLGNYALASEAYRRALLRGNNSEQALEAWAGFALERFRQIGESLRASEEGLAAIRRIQTSAGSANIAGSEKMSCEASIPALETRISFKQSGRAHFDTEACYQLSVCYARAAGQVAERLQSGTKDKAAAYRLRGDVLLRLKGDGTAAQAEYSKGLALDSKNPALLDRLAEAQLETGDTDAARASAKAALAIDPHQRDALRTLAALAMNERNYEEALPLLRQLSIGAPGDSTVAMELGRALAQKGDPAEALKWLGPPLAAGYPDEKGSSHALLARVLRKLGREQEAARAEAESRRLSDTYQAHSHAGETSQDSRIANPTGTDENR
jgi:predicted Zn-dependent protease